VHISGQIHS